MEYLINKKRIKAKAHIWDAENQDTVCRMYSTDGLLPDNYIQSDHLYGKTLCKICKGMYSHKKEVNRLVNKIEIDKQNSTAVPTALINDNNLSWSAKGVAMTLYFHCDSHGLFDVARIRDLRFQNSQEINQGLHELLNKNYIAPIDESETVYRLTLTTSQ